MGKARYSGKELTALQELKYENQRLKRENDQLRKALARIDLDKYSQVKKTVEKHCQQDKAQEGKELLERIKGEWKCHESGCDGFLEIFTYNKVGNTWYYRICSAAPFCKNRTKAQKYSTTVKGIMRKDKENK